MKHILLLIALFVVPNVVASAETLGLRRWAILADESIRQSGLADLLSAKLTGVVELVERDELKRVTRELELAAVSRSAASDKRLQLGKLVKADALLILTAVEFDQKVSLRLVISECRYGARLLEDVRPFHQRDFEALVAWSQNSVTETRRRFQDGIRYLICVPPFLSRNLTHDYDHLQTGYASLLAVSLAEFPGVAVIETEEARSIARELSISGEPLKNRVVPMFVEGEFEMSAAEKRDSSSVRLAVRLMDGAKVRAKGEQTGLAPDEVVALLTARIPRRIVQFSSDRENHSLSPLAQRKKLNTRADAFAQIGAWRQSVRLREAALLLAPNDSSTRIDLIVDCSLWQRDPLPGVRESPQEIADQRIERYRIIGAHIEHLMRQRALNPAEVNWLVMHENRFVLGTLQDPLEIQRIKQATEEYFWRIYTRMSELDYSLRNGALSPRVTRMRRELPSRESSKGEQIADWTQQAISYITQWLPRVDGRRKTSTLPWDDRNTLENLYRFIRHTTGTGVAVRLMGHLTMGQGHGTMNSMIREGRFTANEVAAFYDRLSRTDQPLNHFYAACGRMSLKLQAFDESPNESWLKEVDTLRKSIDGLPIARSEAGRFKFRLRRLRKEIESKLKPAVEQKQFALTANPLVRLTAPRRIRFEPVAIGVTPDWFGLIRCGESLDVMWSGRDVYVMREPGNITRIFRTSSVSDVKWDGRNIWIAAAKRGVFVLSSAGEQLAHVSTENGLPPDKRESLRRHYAFVGRARPADGMKLHPIGVGRALVMGRLSRKQRNWIALVSVDAANTTAQPLAPDVKVIHTATHVPTNPAMAGASNDAEAMYEIEWLREFSPREDPDRRFLLVGRNNTLLSPHKRLPSRPLAIDLKDQSVSLFSTLYLHEGSRAVHADDGRLFFLSPIACEVHQPATAEGQSWQRQSMYDLQNDLDYRRCLAGLPTQHRQILNAGGRFLVPGRTWHEINPTPPSSREITVQPLPLQHCYQHYAVSAHYGMIGWNVGDRIYRIRIEDFPSREPRLSALYPYVPAAQREQHHEAVEAIERAGGFVDAYYFGPLHEVHAIRRRVGSRLFIPKWRTIVFLPAGWQGGDEELRHLADMHDVAAVIMVGADVTDEGLKHLLSQPKLETLQLIETAATDSGLEHVSQLSGLVHLRLEGSAGGRGFTNSGLQHVQNLSKLQELDLYGPGFSDDGIEAIKALPNLRALWIVDTEISPEAQGEVKKSKPWYVLVGTEPWFLRSEN